MNIDEISAELAKLSPAKRVKYLRQTILKQNQAAFCKDGIIRSGTLKSIESERMMIGRKIADRLIHKLSLEGIVSDVNIFLDKNSPCHIIIDTSKKELSGGSICDLEEIRQKITQLTPINITTEEYTPFIPMNSTLLAREILSTEYRQLNKKLCFIKGDKASLYYLTYLNENEIEAEINNQKIIISPNIMNFCSIYLVELIYIKPM